MKQLCPMQLLGSINYSKGMQTGIHFNTLDLLLNQVNLSNHSMMFYYVYPETNGNLTFTFVQHFAFDHIQLTSQPTEIFIVHIPRIQVLSYYTLLLVTSNNCMHFLMHSKNEKHLHLPVHNHWWHAHIVLCHYFIYAFKGHHFGFHYRICNCIKI